jgi:undecaprenyl-diphosphatase
MEWWEAALLGLIQGLTEFLPVSSSGHLVLGQYLLGIELSESITFEVFVHLGTVLSILTLYWDQAWRILRETLAVLVQPAQIAERYATNEHVRFGLLILVTMVPTGLVYVLLGDWLQAAFANPRLVCGMLLVTGTLLLLTVLRPDPRGPLTTLKAFVIGLAQSAAMIPGISRSGSTICVALYQKVTPKKAADFSFLMLLPVVLGATLLDTIDIVEQGTEVGVLPLVIGTGIAYASGIVAIKVVLDFVKRGKLQYFAYYCFALGGLGLWLI